MYTCKGIFWVKSKYLTLIILLTHLNLVETLTAVYGLSLVCIYP